MLPEVVKLHPPATHFAIAMPVALLLIEALYRRMKREPDVIHEVFTHISFLSVLLASLTGFIAHEPLEERLKQVPVFSAHEILGFSLPFLFLVISAIRLFKRKDFSGMVRNVYFLLLLLGVFLIFLQGRLGGKIVYEYLIE
ncbi:DUF2231 domain-containing protein [Thermocrinis minervae]|uniref:Uncharacterized membrane protein n=1 Tax=Thermocrinis minervae TaxID=381751 RepID=A0A1M6Q1I4_9AQUI|nr:DUF2231 domain-containing protein [Thermocrinis minervae]SHK14115.1 Uncharacterized membrane protein [Thermocrinis minervae]